jgi:hypothetical protein
MAENYASKRAIEKLHEAVEAAIEANWSPGDLVREARISWSAILDDKQNDDDREFSNIKL